MNNHFDPFMGPKLPSELKRPLRRVKTTLLQKGRKLALGVKTTLLNLQCIFEIDDSNVISIKPPNNGYILENSVCCMVTAEVVDSQCKEKMFSCRVYDRSDPRFVDPCDSRIIGVHSVSNRNSRMKLLPASSLKKRALVFPLETSSFLFLTILHQC